MRGKAGLFERVREGIVPDVVKQGREPDREAVVLRHEVDLAALLQARQRPPGQVIRAEGVLESGVRGAGIDQERMPHLADVAEPLDRRRVQRQQRGAIQADVVPEGVANDLELFVVGHGRMREPRARGIARGRGLRMRNGYFAAGPAAATESDTWERKCSKFSRNMRTSSRAWAS